MKQDPDGYVVKETLQHIENSGVRHSDDQVSNATMKLVPKLYEAIIQVG